jgi:hypothetical protein
MGGKMNLIRDADRMLREARCDAITGEVKDRAYKLKTRVQSRRAKRLAKRKEWGLGKLGAASKARVIMKNGKVVE